MRFFSDLEMLVRMALWLTWGLSSRGDIGVMCSV